MSRDGLPRAYLRIDPNIDQVYPELRLTFIGLMCAASRQPARGRFRDRALLEGLFSRSFVSKAIARGDIREMEDGRWYLVGWDEWQEGDLDVASRMRRMRARRRDEPAPRTGKERTADWRLKTQVLERDGFTCRYCGAYEYPRTMLVAEHVVPYPRGKTTLDNLVTACGPCNVRKGTRTPEEAGMTLQPVGYRSEMDPLGDTPRVTRSVTRHEPPGSVTVTTDAVVEVNGALSGVSDSDTPQPPTRGGRRSEGTNPRAVAAELTRQAERAEAERRERRKLRQIAYLDGRITEAQRVDMDERDASLSEIPAKRGAAYQGATA